MAVTLTAQAPRVPIGTTEDGKRVYIDRAWYQFLAVDMFTRVGGAEAPSNNDIVSADDTSPIDEEARGLLLNLIKRVEALEQSPNTDAIIGLLLELTKRIDALEQNPNM